MYPSTTIIKQNFKKRNIKQEKQNKLGLDRLEKDWGASGRQASMDGSLHLLIVPC
jgi:hypothetical protein